MFKRLKERKILRFLVENRSTPLTSQEIGERLGQRPEKAAQWARDAIMRLHHQGLVVPRNIEGKKGVLASAAGLSAMGIPSVVPKSKVVENSGASKKKDESRGDFDPHGFGRLRIGGGFNSSDNNLGMWGLHKVGE